MEKSEFYSIFEDFRYRYKNSKDGGWDEFYALTFYVKNLNNKEQDDFIKYCVDEIKNENNVSWYSAIVSKVQNPIAIDLLYDTYITFKNSNSPSTEIVLGTLFELKDTNEEHILQYDMYIHDYVSHLYSIDNFFLILKYLFIDPQKSINILSGYFNIMFTNSCLIDSIKEKLITFLAYCELTSFDYLHQLVSVSENRNPLLASKLISTLKELCSSDRLYYDKKIKHEIKNYLDNLR